MQIKAGGIPFVKIKDKAHVCLFVSNNAEWGGPDPQLPKGGVDKGEKVIVAAMREAHEETGISKFAITTSQVTHLASDVFKGQLEQYELHVYAFEILTKSPVKKNDEGTGIWLELSDAEKKMRKDQLKYLKLLKEKAL